MQKEIPCAFYGARSPEMSRPSKKLTEFDLDAPALSKEVRHAFRLQTRFLTSNVERRFKPFLNDIGAWKVLVEVVPSVTKSRSRNLLGVLTTQVVGDAAEYITMKRGEKEPLALDWLLAGVRSVFCEYGWRTDEIEAAVQSAVDDAFRNVLVWKASVLNASKSASVDIVVESNDEQAKIVAVFRTPGSEQMQDATLCVRPPSEFAFVPCLGKLKWLDDDTVELTSRSGSESWTATRRQSH
jgi:hypothetical protein